MSTFNNFQVDKINGQMSFHINNIDISIVNAIRRIILSEMPNVSIYFDPYDQDNSGILFITNTTSLHNEFLGHRLSLIPIKLPEYEIEDYQEDTYHFEINKHNTSQDKQDVTTNDIKIFSKDGVEYPKETHEKIFPVSPLTNDPILIAVLKPNLYNKDFGDKLHVKFKANIGIAKDHARYSPVSTCTYFNVIDDEKANAVKNQLIQKTEAKLTEKLGKKTILDETEKIRLENRFNVHDAYRYFKTNEYDEPNCVQFSLESECHMTPRYLFMKAMQILVIKLEKLVNKTQHKKRYDIKSIETDSSYHIKINGEQHTMGNLLQCLFYNMFVRETPMMSFIGYNLIHPLSDDIILKLKINTPVNVSDVDDLFQKGVQNIIKYLKELESIWIHDYDLQMGSSQNIEQKKLVRRIIKK